MPKEFIKDLYYLYTIILTLKVIHDMYFLKAITDSLNKYTKFIKC